MTSTANDNVLDILEARGFIHQTTDDEGNRDIIRALLGGAPITAYIGFDPTASSLHVGNLVTIMALVHLQNAGHRPIAIVGGGTGLVGDPSGKEAMRKLLTKERVEGNLRGIRAQLGRYLDFENDRALVLNNADWLASLNYLEFLRDYGRHFSVNRMLSHDCFRTRFASDAGLSFLEFNYMLLQAYDFLVLSRQYGCILQLGGSDQWGNIVAGMELIRRADRGDAHGITFPLIQTADGRKMGKSESGAIWLDAGRTSPYDYYQFWINTDDRDVGRFLRLFTLLDLGEVAALESLQGRELNRAKAVLAFEATRITHGEDDAKSTRDAARALFDGRRGGDVEGLDMPTFQVEAGRLAEGVPAIIVAAEGKLCSSKNEARRLARQGGLYVNGDAVAEDRALAEGDLRDGTILLRAGKKRYLRVVKLR